MKKLIWGNFCTFKSSKLGNSCFKESLRQIFLLKLLWSPWTQSSRAPWKAKLKKICSAFYGTFEHEARELHERSNYFFLLGLQLSVLKVGSQAKTFCVWLLMEPWAQSLGVPREAEQGDYKVDCKKGGSHSWCKNMCNFLYASKTFLANYLLHDFNDGTVELLKGEQLEHI